MKKYLLTLPVFAMLPIALTAQAVVSLWDFTDGSSLTTTNNSGTSDVAWGGDLDAVSISGGNLLITGNPASTATVNATLASPVVGSGKYLFEVTFSAWNFTVVDTTGIWNLGIGVLDGTAFLGRALLRYDGDPDLRAATNTAVQNRLVTVSNDMGLSSAGSVTVGVEFDFDTSIFRYFVDGTQSHEWADFNGTQITGFSISQFGTAGSWDDANASIAIDSIQLTAVPEPSTYALLVGMVGLGLVKLRRRRK